MTHASSDICSIDCGAILHTQLSFWNGVLQARKQKIPQYVQSLILYPQKPRLLAAWKVYQPAPIPAVPAPSRSKSSIGISN